MKQPSPAPIYDSADRANMKLIYPGFVLTGVATTLLGPLIPILASQWHIGDERTGYLFTAQFLGSMTGILFAGRLFRRYGYLHPIAVSFLIMATGSAGLGFAPWPYSLATIFLTGIGLGAVIPGCNLYVAAQSVKHRATRLSVLNLVWGIGAVAGPPLIAITSRSHGLFPPNFALGLALAITGVILLFKHEPPARTENVTENQASPLNTLLQWTPAALIGAFIFLYVGTENAVGGWVASYANRIGNRSGSSWMLAPSVFWGALLTGRGLAPALLRRISEGALTVGGIVWAIGGNLLLILTNSGPLVTAGIAIAGLGFASVYPLTISRLSEFYGESAHRIASPVFAMAALGGASLPWGVGYVSSTFQSLRSGLMVPLVASLAMITIQLFIIPLSRHRTTQF